MPSLDIIQFSLLINVSSGNVTDNELPHGNHGILGKDDLTADYEFRDSTQPPLSFLLPALCQIVKPEMSIPAVHSVC
jgi:hypothetical protein